MDASTIRWPASHYYPAKKLVHEFKVGDNVMIARLSPHIWTDQSIIGHRGVITEVDEHSMSSVEMHCFTCRGDHTMHEAELDYLGSSDMAEMRSKAGLAGQLEMEPITEAATVARDLDDAIAVAMHKAGFLQPAVEDRPIPVCDPDLPQPVWSKYVYGKIWRMAAFKAFHAPLIEIARSVDGHLVEWSSFSLDNGWIPITTGDLETLTLEMPIRAVIQSRRNGIDSAYDEAKEKISEWIEDEHDIDIASIMTALAPFKWKMSNWQKPTRDSDWASFRIELPKDISAGEAREIFKEWAENNWLWSGKFCVTVCTVSDIVAEGVEIEWYEGTVRVGDEADVPF
jgi:hypothetical protein